MAQMTSRLLVVFAAIGAATVTAPVGHAQVRPKADTAAIVEHETIRAGGPARVALQVSLPETFHVQSNKPRDPSLIATELSDRRPAGRDGRGGRVSGGDRSEAGRRRSAARRLSARLRPRRSARDRRHGGPRRCRRPCFTSDTRRATITCAFRRRQRTRAGRCTSCRRTRAAAASRSAYRSVFDKIAFGHGEAPAAPAVVADRQGSRRARRDQRRGPGSLDRFAVAGSRRRLPRAATTSSGSSTTRSPASRNAACSKDTDRSRFC